LTDSETAMDKAVMGKRAQGTGATGSVAIVGAGPGALDYLTVRGYFLLTQAQVVVYDALVDETLLTLTPPGCEHIYVGKRGGQPSLKQPTIDQLLVQQCQRGRRVVRLKSGDPFIFGRTSSEIQALHEVGGKVEVVPGISSALAAPLLTGIPLTDPAMSRTVALVSAHDPDSLDWEALARMDTLVLLMGARHLAIIVQQLMQRGRSPQTPTAIIRWAGQPQQQIWTGTLQSIVQKTAHQSLAPAVILIGEVVSLRPYLLSEQSYPPTPPTPPLTVTVEPDPTLSPTTTLASTPVSSLQSPSQPAAVPLSGKTVLVTRAAGQSSQFAALLQAQGATVLEMPAIEITAPSSWQALDGAIARLQQFDWLILTSANGVEYFFERLMAQGKDARHLATLKIAVVGKKTAASLSQRGILPDFTPTEFVADALVQEFPVPLAGVRVLFPRVETGGRDVLVQALTTAHAEIVEVPAYQSQCATAMPAAVRQALVAKPSAESSAQSSAKSSANEPTDALAVSGIDIVTFASAKTVRCFQQMLQREGISLPPTCQVASIGPQTSVACREQLGRVDLEAAEYTLEGLAQAIVQRALQPVEAE
jgi:uroporphyrinogen III methyltransferase/synthase